jgi:hypothetical protein
LKTSGISGTGRFAFNEQVKPTVSVESYAVAHLHRNVRPDEWTGCRGSGEAEEECGNEK